MSNSSNLVRMGTAANFFFALVSLFPPCLTAQFGSAPALLPLTSITGITCLSGFSRVQSPSISAWDTSWRATAITVPSPFGLADLQSHRAMVSGKSNSWLGTTIALEAFGGSLYREFNGLASVSTQISSLTSFGVSVAYSQLTIASERSFSALRFDIGATILLPQRSRGSGTGGSGTGGSGAGGSGTGGSGSRISITMHNVLRSGIGTSTSSIPQDVAIAYGDAFDDDLEAEVQYRIVLQRSRSVQCALSYRIASAVSFRCAADLSTTTLGMESAINVTQSMRILSSVCFQPVLGLRIGGGVSWSL